jgi:GH24 family phage-related lysozyme (muramidase)
MKLLQKGVDLIRSYEKCKLVAYTATEKEKLRDIWTIGWGMTFYPETKEKVKEGDELNQQAADDMFAQMLEIFCKEVRDCITKEQTTDEQFSALVSVAYNAGTTKFRKTELLKQHNTGNIAGAKELFCSTLVTQDGEVLRGLVFRRQKEAKLYSLET